MKIFQQNRAFLRGKINEHAEKESETSKIAEKNAPVYIIILVIVNLIWAYFVDLFLINKFISDLINTISMGWNIFLMGLLLPIAAIIYFVVFSIISIILIKAPLTLLFDQISVYRNGVPPTVSSYEKGLSGEESVETTLSIYPDNYVLINDVVLGNSSGNIDHILICPKGIFAIETKNWSNKIPLYYKNDEWYTLKNTDKRVVNRDYDEIPDLYGRYPAIPEYDMRCNPYLKKYPISKSPSKQAKINAIQLREELLQGGFDYWVDAVLVFIDKNILILSDSQPAQVTILKLDEMLKFFDKKQNRLQIEEINQISNYILSKITV
jgi:hypothetical protein